MVALARWSGGSASAQRYLVGFGDVTGLDGSQAQPQALASLPQQLEGVGRGSLRGGALRISAVFLDEMGLQSGGDLVDRLQRVIDGPVSCCVVNHAASIACPSRPRSRDPRLTWASPAPGWVARSAELDRDAGRALAERVQGLGGLLSASGVDAQGRPGGMSIPPGLIA